MAYNNVKERQRATFLTFLGAAHEYKSHDELMYAYLAGNGYTQATLPEKLAAWAKANNTPVTKAYTTLGA